MIFIDEEERSGEKPKLYITPKSFLNWDFKVSRRTKSELSFSSKILFFLIKKKHQNPYKIDFIFYADKFWLNL
jgi:hypothetical protein